MAFSVSNESNEVNQCVENQQKGQDLDFLHHTRSVFQLNRAAEKSHRARTACQMLLAGHFGLL